MAQTVRFATLEKFKAGELQLLVCSDVAARGLDIGGLSHVFNFDVPHHAEDYVHRIGRTGRAGLEGHAFTIATPEDRCGGRGDREADRPSDTADERRGSRSGRLGRRRWPPATCRGTCCTAEDFDPGEAARAGKAGTREAACAARTRGSRSRPAREKAAPQPRAAKPAPGETPRAASGRPGVREPTRHPDEEQAGARVTGFGDDMPAFMLLRPRNAAN